MQVGDLVFWENTGGEYEQGIIVEVCDTLTKNVDYMVYFFLDKAVSCMPSTSLEVICK